MLKHRLTSLTLALLLAIAPGFATAENDPHTQMLLNFIQRALDNDAYQTYLTCERNDEEACFTLLFKADEHWGGQLGHIRASVQVAHDGILVQACCEKTAPPDRIDEVARFCNLMNSRSPRGRFRVDCDSGEIFYEEFLLPEYVLASEESAQDSLLLLLYSAVNQADYNACYFAAVIDGQTAETAYSMSDPNG